MIVPDRAAGTAPGGDSGQTVPGVTLISAETLAATRLPGRCALALSQADQVTYASASPWPHLVIDGAFDPALVRGAEVEQVAIARGLRAQVTRRLVKAEQSLVLGEASQMLMAQLDSDEFVGLLGDLTGVPALQADTSRSWAGLHVGPTGSFQSVHRDFQRHPGTGLYHRLNVLVYLSSAWRAEEGGELELWSADATRCVRSIAPIAGRMVIFESNAKTPHAVARQTSPDPDRLRLSLAAYYYSVQAPAVGLRRGGTLIQPRIPGQGRLAPVMDALEGVRYRVLALPSHVNRHLQRALHQKPPTR